MDADGPEEVGCVTVSLPESNIDKNEKDKK